MKLGVIGAGNMAKAMVQGMIAQGIYSPGEILLSRRDEDALNSLKQELGVEITTENIQVAKQAEILLLAVKPQMMEAVIEEIKETVNSHQLIITIAAGKPMTWYEECFGKEIKLIRDMPNTPAMVGEGCSAYCVGKLVTKEEEAKAKAIFDSYGTSFLLAESMMDNFGALAGSGPAFVFMFLEAMADGAVLNGMPRQMAYEIAAQTLLGSAKLAKETGKHPGELKDMVCSPGGTTICGIRTLEEKGMRAALINALNSCVEKSQKL